MEMVARTSRQSTFAFAGHWDGAGHADLEEIARAWLARLLTVGVALRGGEGPSAMFGTEPRDGGPS